MFTPVRTASNNCWRCLTHSKTIPSLGRTILSLQNIPKRFYATPSATGVDAPVDLAHTRNIGIIAHIDAGKTTTTERMLYYSGFTRRIGEVDEGSTVMDYLPAERSRGITITSAAITFNWTPSAPGSQPYTINLIDTPGHADFTFEVERSIRVLDGAVTILDGVAGVEAQTEKVWRQAEKYGIPRLIFVNKLDRVGAKFGPTVKEIALKLNAWPAVLQLPIYEQDKGGRDDIFRGLVDIVEKRVFVWDLGGDGQKIDVHDYNWLEENRPDLYSEALTARVALVELLSEHDEELVEVFLDIGDHHTISSDAIKKSLRKQTLRGSSEVVPVLCGASFKNIGVQPLLDAVIDYLPSPLDKPETEISYDHGKAKGVLSASEDRLCALAFKVVNDPKRGAMVFVRVYSGTLVRAHHLYNTTLGVKERVHRLLRMYADDAVDIQSIPTGHIGVIIGLKNARTGDTLISDHHHHHSGKGNKHHQKASDAFGTVQLRPIEVPPPVFFASIEPNSLSEQKPLEDALSMLLREDPSLHITTDEDSGQMLISGMGELHLEIARDRLVGELKAKAEMGRILISYRETIPSTSEYELRTVFEKEIAGKLAKAGCHVSVIGLNEPPILGLGTPNETIVDGNIISVDIVAPEQTLTMEEAETVHTKLPKSIDIEELKSSLISGAMAALGRGPYLGFPVRNTSVKITIDPSKDYFGTESTLSAYSSAARLAATAALKEAIASNEEGILMEPMMNVIVTVDEKDLGKVVGDLSSSRGGHVLELGGGDEEVDRLDTSKVYAPGQAGKGNDNDGGVGGKRWVVATVPLKEMVGYLKHLRSMTTGRGTFVMNLLGWERMTRPRAVDVLKDIRGG
ncbi:P-loop containing nucleoside triphosphate hydrolase protein [Choiromyces venosus 120613-1]|uniref:Ribosome-releasing factor 2, mitochondrial n=1 Tax=Choiromyces venosus 120613-1 TaxID=1336337 RepID=A0A3N4K6P5_9PEZI|nr:P-loop containing nucleoside triphosphate hydrolase protein [Choiromyces venosus 120613-1]